MVATQTTTARTATARTATARTTGASRPADRRAVNVALWTIQILLAAFLLIASAAPKFAGQRDAVETFAKIGWGQWFRYVTGAVEAAGGIGLLIPRLAAWAGLGLIGLMIGAIITQVFVLVPAFAVLPAVFGVLFAVIARVRMPQAVSPAVLFRR
ncbi:DoxX family protein [Actinoallomurus rhizosphaericola]|uniref:DoxX family protein n=1 Tax=Actinoallomurus rhizosphaericola TaxID=2952536 RepID=UPI00209063B5|nr:DoxX family protein [Actinoallomurus rhizosphaericola]MCO5994182.1 DoxX family protein [Actinoallomurus rhizosphaericola]